MEDRAIMVAAQEATEPPGGSGDPRLLTPTQLSAHLACAHYTQLERKRRAGELEVEYAAAFFPELRQCGAVLAIDGRVQGLELFDAPSAFARYFAKLVRGYALDAVETANGKVLAPPEEEVRRFLERVGAAAGECFAALGEGEDIRLSGEGLAGGALAAGGRVVHLAAHGVA